MRIRNSLSIFLSSVSLLFLPELSDSCALLMLAISAGLMTLNFFLLNPELTGKAMLFFGIINCIILISTFGVIINVTSGFSTKLIMYLMVSFIASFFLIKVLLKDLDLYLRYVSYKNTFDELREILSEDEKKKIEFINSRVDPSNMLELLVEFEAKEIQTLLKLDEQVVIELINNFDIVQIEGYL
ncbi:MAG: hypothetical protein IKV94_03120 [Clostridia bacterium]|nr:hypothetical protein [Clostridia bacterium]